MKNLLLALSLCLSTVAFAAPKKFATHKVSNPQVKALIAKMQGIHKSRSQKIRKLSEPLVKIFIAPSNEPKQGEPITIFSVPNTGFTDSEVLLEAKLDNAIIALEHPSEDLWMYDAGAATEIKGHDFVISMFIQDKAQASQIREAILSLEADIASLNEQIANATDPEVIADLTAQRDEKLSLKAQLVTALANLKSPVGTESLHYNVVEQATGIDFPRISDVSPHLLPRTGGAQFTITGANFGANPEVILGGISTAVVSSDSTSITLISPAFPNDGAMDVELRFTADGITKNAIRKNAFYVSSDVALPPPVNHLPVSSAYAVTPNPEIGTVATLSGERSYDLNGQPIAYHWTLVSKPAGSNLPLNVESNGMNMEFTPDVPGVYVASLLVNEATAPFASSYYSFAMVDATGPANRAPTASAPAITVGVNGTKTSQVSASDADFWQQRTLFISKQGSLGTASISSTGLVTYVAGSTSGTDEVNVLVIDNGTPPLSTTLSIPVNVQANLPPVIQSTPVAFLRTQGTPIQVRLGLSGIGSGAITDPDGTVAKAEWTFGDGTKERTLDFATGGILHNYMAPGTYTVTLTATDNLGATSSTSGTITVVNTDVPTAKVTAAPNYGPTPLTVNFDASEAFDADGITEYRWFFTGASSELVTTSPTASYTYTFGGPIGTIGVRLRTRDIYGAEGEAVFGIFPGTTPILPGLVTQPKAVNRELPLGVAHEFDGLRSFNPVAGVPISSYLWRFGDVAFCPSCAVNNPTTTYTYADARNHTVTLQVAAPNGQSNFPAPLETWSVNAGHAPRAILRVNRTSGPAPLTITMDASESYDYDGTLDDFGWTFGEGPDENGTASAKSHTYNTPGMYNITLAAKDNDQNTTYVSTLITVNPSNAKVKKLDMPYDPDREYLRQLLTSACFEGSGHSCHQLGVMYQEDGDDYTKTLLWEKACGLGYEPACGR